MSPGPVSKKIRKIYGIVNKICVVVYWEFCGKIVYDHPKPSMVVCLSGSSDDCFIIIGQLPQTRKSLREKLAYFTKRMQAC